MFGVDNLIGDFLDSLIPKTNGLGGARGGGYSKGAKLRKGKRKRNYNVGGSISSVGYNPSFIPTGKSDWINSAKEATKYAGKKYNF